MKSRYVGVSYEPHSRLWFASIRHLGKLWELGAFEQAADAARRYDRVARFLGYEEHGLNFPAEELSPLDPRRVREELRLQLAGQATSPYDGVYRAVMTAGWHAELFLSRSVRWLGLWPSELLAARAVDRARLYYEGADAPRNLQYAVGELVPASAEMLQAEARRLAK
ncbi:MAG: hypothetical protein H6718_29025 [Polyangiaceae bacterium]|nr:hypothetical protein [Polyangiaceae bacterium]